MSNFIAVENNSGHENVMVSVHHIVKTYSRSYAEGDRAYAVCVLVAEGAEAKEYVLKWCPTAMAASEEASLLLNRLLSMSDGPKR